METVYKRNRLDGRVIRKNIAAATAAEAIGPITRGCEIFGLSKGQFSLIDIIIHCLAATGPAEVVLSTWTAANADMGFAYELLKQGAITSLQFVVDFSFPTRQPEYCAAMRERFGDSCIRVTKTHAKFVVIKNADWNIVIRSSMNLNENKRLESFEVSDDAGMAGFCVDLVAELFAGQEDGACFANTPFQNCKEFGKLREGGKTVCDEDVMASTDAAKYFGDGRYSNDLRRAGVMRA